MNEYAWVGARWWKFDFHAHTPASEDYGKGPNQAILKQRTPEDWLLDYMRAGIDCVAITDHNSGAWIDRLKEALKTLEEENHPDFRPIYLFPGVELTVNGGVHILVILDPQKGTSDIDTLLGTANFLGTKGLSDTCTQSSFIDIAKRVVELGGIVIPAHVDQPNGIFHEFSGITLEQILNSDCISAIEVYDPSYCKPQLYIDKKLSWTEVLGSDAHHPSGPKSPGSHFTWVKMEKPSLEGLRLALLDGPLSVKRSDNFSGDPNDHSPLFIEEIEVSNARYMGRGKSFKVLFNPWLNTIIGGRGTGKSTLIEFLRLALQRKQEIPETLKGDFEKYYKAYQSREEDGLLTNNTLIKVLYQKDKTRFRIQWNQNNNIASIEQEQQDGTWVNTTGDIIQRFPVRIYSQKQIFELARDPHSLLKIIDEAPEVDYHTWEEQWREERTRYLSLCARAREIEAGLAGEIRLKGEFEDTKRKLELFEKLGHANVLKIYHRRLRQRHGLEKWEESWAKTGNLIRSITREIIPPIVEDNLFEPGDSLERNILDEIGKISERLKAIAQKVEELAAEADQLWNEWLQIKTGSIWMKSVEEAEAKYKELTDKLKEQGVNNPDDYGILVKRLQDLEDRIKDLDLRRRNLEDIQNQKTQSKARLIELRRELTDRRKRFLNNVLRDNPYVQIEVIPYAAKETVEKELREILGRENGGFERDIGSIDGEGLLGQISWENPEAGIEIIKNQIRCIATGQACDYEAKDSRFVNYLQKRPPETFDYLDCWFPEDSLEVRYSTTSNGSDFRSIREGSPGQKTAALLAFLFLYGDEPIILDQPEDDLDNQLIYNLIVTQLRKIKHNRQVIVVTHNANIVVNGDAEYVVSLFVKNGQTYKRCEGSLQKEKVRNEICDIMEGGRDAFKLRYRRITIGNE